jgi:homoserine O-succinyltransferase
MILNPKHPLMRGFDDYFLIPHSRYTGIRTQDIEAIPELEILATSRKAGVAIICSKNGREFYLLGHCEYDYDTLAKEYFRDKEKGLPIDVPYNYFPDDDPTKTPKNVWRGHAHLLFSNWLNYFVYQATPYDLEKI